MDYFKIEKKLDIAFFSQMLFNKYIKREKVPINSEFNEKKAIEVILFLAKKYYNPDVFAICKLLYIVDKISLEKFGRFLFGESYCAMRHGSVPSNAYNLLKKARKENINGLEVNGNNIIASREANISLLSESDIECLNQVIGAFNDLPGWMLYKASHDKAWEKNWKKKRDKKRSVPIPIKNIAELLEDSKNLADYILDFV